MKYLIVALFALFTSLVYASDSLIEALTHGKFSGDFDAHYGEGSDEEGKTNTGYSKLYLEYTLPPIMGIDISFATQSNSQLDNNKQSANKIIYSEAVYERRTENFDYRLSANYYSTVINPNEDIQTVTSRAVGLKAQITLDEIQAYIALSKVSDSPYEITSHPSLEGRDKLLPTASLLLSNNDAPNSKAAALDIRYFFNKNMALGSRYSVMEDDKTINSYNGIYSSIMLNDIIRGLQMTVAYDKKHEGDEEKQWSVQFKSHF